MDYILKEALGCWKLSGNIHDIDERTLLLVHCLKAFEWVGEPGYMSWWTVLSIFPSILSFSVAPFFHRAWSHCRPPWFSNSCFLQVYAALARICSRICPTIIFWLRMDIPNFPTFVMIVMSVDKKSNSAAAAQRNANFFLTDHYNRNQKSNDFPF